MGHWGSMHSSAGSKLWTVPGEWCLSNTTILSDFGALSTLIPPPTESQYLNRKGDICESSGTASMFYSCNNH